MKLIFWLLLPAIAVAFSSQDLEIFHLRDAVIKDLGEDATFYSWLGVKPTAKRGSITRAFRKMSQQLHPDKNAGIEASSRYARLNSVHRILVSELREHYDFYLKNGFPELKDGDYKFSRWRPGLFFSLTVLSVLVTFGQLGLMKLHASRQRKFVQDIIDEARELASDSSGIVTAKTHVTISSGKSFNVYPTGIVALITGSGEEVVNPKDVPEPSIANTFLFRFPAFFAGFLRGLLKPNKKQEVKPKKVSRKKAKQPVE